MQELKIQLPFWRLSSCANVSRFIEERINKSYRIKNDCYSYSERNSILLKLTGNLSKVYKERFKGILLPLGFKFKGSLFIRVVNEEIIQTVNTFKNSPIDFTLNIGVFPFSRDNDKLLLKEGNYRLYDFAEPGEFRYNPLSLQSVEEVMEDCISQFQKEVLPIFEMVQTEEDYLIFEKNFEMNRYGEISYLSDEKLYVNLKLRNYSEVIKVVEAFWDQNVSAITDKYNDGFYDFKTEEEFQTYLNNRLQRWKEILTAIGDNNTDYLDSFVETNRNNTKAILKDYGYIF